MGKERYRERVRVKANADGTVVEVESPEIRFARRRKIWIIALSIILLVAGGFAAIRYWPRAVEREPGPAPEGMVWIPGGTFWMGYADPKTPDSGPVHEVTLDGFWIDTTEVTNEEFERFVKSTGYVTNAEKQPQFSDNPEIPPSMLKAGSMVFAAPKGDPTENRLLYWRFVPGADWRHPEGPDSSIQGRETHPVVHVCWGDAVAYAEWAGKRLPTEAEWEYAARGGLDRMMYCWGDQLKPGNRWLANIWQGSFPSENTGEDGFLGTAPVRSFPPNGYGLYDMAGNVWEWCFDWYRPDYYAESLPRNPSGPPFSQEPSSPLAPRRVQRGGSFLSVDANIRGFLPGTRNRGDPMSQSSHVGFRCVKSP